MNCPNCKIEMILIANGHECPKCKYSFVSIVKPKSSVIESRNRAIQEANTVIKTSLIKSRLNGGLAPWQQPWVIVPKQNYASKHVYRGINRWLLPSTCEYWVTEKKAIELGGTKKPDAHSFFVVAYVPPKRLTAEQKSGLSQDEIDKAERRKFWIPVGHTVYQYTDWNLPDREAHPVEKKFNDVGTFLYNIEVVKGISIKHQGNVAIFNHGEDCIYVPKESRFTSTAEYFMAMFHEIIHATGHKSRLNRYNLDKDAKKRDAQYGAEELVAEIGASYLARLFNIEIPANAMSYLDGWLKAVEGDAYLLSSASSQAEKALDYLLN